MALPELDTPTYRLTLPSTKKEIQYRPFLVKEQKLLMMAQESEDDNQVIDMVSQVVSACTFEKIDVNTSPMFDIEYIFLQIRGKSVGETIDLVVTCGDDGVTEVPITVNIDDIQVKKSDDHSTDIELADGYSVRMKYPSISQFVETNFQDESKDQVEKSFNIVANSIDMVYNEEEMFSAAECTKKELKEWVESLTSEQFQKIEGFFNTMPKLQHTLKVKNPKTKKENTVVLEGLTDFFA